LLGVKPQKLDEVAAVLEPALGEDTILVSILAGVELASLRTRFPRQRRIVRAMPNTPVRLRKGVTELFTDEAGATARPRSSS
jgi:pyrroline-5-carboxylate reductase